MQSCLQVISELGTHYISLVHTQIQRVDFLPFDMVSSIKENSSAVIMFL